jgi:hypothetical protein
MMAAVLSRAIFSAVGGGLAVAMLLGVFCSGASAAFGTGIRPTLPSSAVAYPPGVSVGAVSCPSAGNCAAAGGYVDTSGAPHLLLLTESAGIWQTAINGALPAGATGTGEPNIVCVSAGNCTFAATYQDASSHSRGMALTETAGIWGSPVAISLPAGAAADPGVKVLALSCPTAGNCAAVVTYLDGASNLHSLLWTQSAGVWGSPTAPSLPANAAASQPDTPFVSNGLRSVSCASAGNCTAVGGYVDTANHGQGLSVTETSGVWGTGVKVPLPGDAAASPKGDLGQVSCSSAGNCTAVGTYTGSAFEGLLITETSGVWSTGLTAPLPADAATNPYVQLGSLSGALSCPAANSCTALGVYAPSGGGQYAVAWDETSGAWRATELNVSAASEDGGFVSCASAGNCSAAGFIEVDVPGFTARAFEGTLWTETAGTWSAATTPPVPADAASGAGGQIPDTSLHAVSCGSVGDCAVVGTYNDNAGSQQGLLLSGNPSPPAGTGGTDGTGGAGGTGGTGGAGNTGGTGGGSAPVATSVIRSRLSSALHVTGAKAKIKALLTHGYQTSFNAPEAGRVTISWYQVPPGAHVAKTKTKPKPLLVASGSASASKPATIKVTVKLTGAGKRLLKHAHRAKLTGKGTFAPSGGKATSTTSSLNLHS